MDGTQNLTPTVTELREWLIERVAVYLPDIEGPIDPQRQLGEYGLDSIVVLALAVDIEDRLEVSLEPTVLWDYPTIDQLAGYLVSDAFRQETQT